jgi:hypothetical protein
MPHAVIYLGSVAGALEVMRIAYGLGCLDIAQERYFDTEKT